MRSIKTLLASSFYIPLSLLGQFVGYYFGIFCTIIWSSTVRGYDGNQLIPFFDDLFPYILSGCIGGFVSAIGTKFIYKKYNPLIILFIPTLATCLTVFVNLGFMLKNGIGLSDIGITIGCLANGFTFYLSLREDYPPELKDLESLNKNIQSDTLSNLEGDRTAARFITRINSVEQHRGILLDTFKRAKTRILLFSGFTSTFALNDELFKLIDEALNRGVDIFIGYGWQHPSSKSQNNINKSEVQKLEQLAISQSEKVTSGRLKLFDFPNHSKVLIMDDV